MISMRLDRLLSNLGYCSRREASALVRQGRISYSGEIVHKADRPIVLQDVRDGLVTFDDMRLDPPSPLTVMLHKPAGYSCSHDEKGRLIYDLLPARWKLRSPPLSSIGRLDKESTGQLLLTDDGHLLHRVIHPKSHAPKHYSVTLAHPLRGDESALFSTGDFLMQGDDKPLKPAMWFQESEIGGGMILEEGRYHQIRRMFETLGNHVVTLHRTQTGGLTLKQLGVGCYEILEEPDIAKLFLKIRPAETKS